MLVAGVAAGAAVRTWPFRVFSFPSQIQGPPSLINPFSSQISGVPYQFGMPDIEFDPEWDVYWVAMNQAVRKQILFRKGTLIDLTVHQSPARRRRGRPVTSH
jgi:hypothetical protein